MRTKQSLHMISLIGAIDRQDEQTHSINLASVMFQRQSVVASQIASRLDPPSGSVRQGCLSRSRSHNFSQLFTMFVQAGASFSARDDSNITGQKNGETF